MRIKEQKAHTARNFEANSASESHAAEQLAST
jgi:hypothetical protein